MFLRTILRFYSHSTTIVLKIKKILLSLPTEQIIKIMTSVQLNAEVLRNMSIIAEDENLMKRAAKYLRKLVAEKEADSAEMTREEFYAKLEKAEEEYRQGKYYEMAPGESLEAFLNRVR